MKQKLPDLRAAIDIGSHSCILLIAAFETDESGKENIRQSHTQHDKWGKRP